MTNRPSPEPVRIAIVGDLLLTIPPGGSSPGRGLEALSDDVRRLFASCDLVLANLECTLTGGAPVPTEPRVFSSTTQVRGLREAGIDAVTLANNHAFDADDGGFHQLTDLLSELGLPYCGAGIDQDEARTPLIFHIHGQTIAVLGFADASSGVDRFATGRRSGVAPLDTKAVCLQIEHLRREVDHVIVSPHWGEERFRLPSPRQIAQGRAFIDAGASVVAGHHPHVVQGLEIYQNAPIAYSLGNFIANPVYWDDGDCLSWSRFERTGCILIAELTTQGVQEIQQVAVYDDGRSVTIDTSAQGARYLQRANRFLGKRSMTRTLRCESFRVRTLLPIISNLTLRKLCTMRPTHLLKALKLLSQGLRWSQPVEPHNKCESAGQKNLRQDKPDRSGTTTEGSTTSPKSASRSQGV